MDAPSSNRVAVHPAGARRVIPEPRRRWLAGGVLAGGWETDERLQLEFFLRPLWIAAPLHVHPTQTERVRVVRGRLGVTTDDGRRVYRAGQVVEIPAGVRHTLWNAGLGTLRLVDEYQPPLRTAQFFDELFTTPVNEPRQLRHVVRDFDDVVRWRPSPIRAVAWIGAIVAVVGAVLGIVARRRRG
jgi:mannose-6-phosphate isomerase-like protein (cupin superfamily)